MAKERSSNFELLRIVSMIGIVFHHFLNYSLGYNEFTYDTITPNSAFAAIFYLLGKIGVNIFVLISGYFLIESKQLKFQSAPQHHARCRPHCITKLINYEFSLIVASTSSASAMMLIGFSTGTPVDISICHLQVSQSVATQSGATSLICLKRPEPMACEVS